ncbi:hypothetical protein ACTQ33_17030 [Candidatus Avoscillospira sp. LCP25S3_F1]|uniref:hypothetical protein n=1 Tax=Candidatus Avoscillospira sp. LCP25S3_F1 TaxID=3438825 RepID=UPI003F8FCFAB
MECDKKCFFIGHRDAPSTIFPILLETVERHITEYGIREFFVGRYGQFDSMAANAVIAAKRNAPIPELTDRKISRKLE